MLMNQNQAYSCLWTRIKHTPCIWNKWSIFMLLKQNQAYSCIWKNQNIPHAYETNQAQLMLMKHANANETKSSTTYAYEPESASLYYWQQLKKTQLPPACTNASQMCRYAQIRDYFLCEIAPIEQNRRALQMIARSRVKRKELTKMEKNGLTDNRLITNVFQFPLRTKDKWS